MLKCVRVVLVCLVVICSLAYVPRAYATSANLMIVHIQAGGVGAATQEAVVLYNNSPAALNITNYCLLNKNDVEFACFETLSPEYSRYLPGYSYAVIASNSYAESSGVPLSAFTLLYEPLTQSSGSITGGSDRLSVLDAAGEVLDQHAWTTALSGGSMLIRSSLPETPLLYIDTDTADDWTAQSARPVPSDQTVMTGGPLPDVCPNVEGQQVIIPAHLYLDASGNCVPYDISPAPIMPLFITELLPNAAGSDAGQEFIELYNPNDETIGLDLYTLQVGQEFEKSYALPNVPLGAKQYYVVSNADIGFNLLNTSSRVRIVSADQTVIDETPAYLNPKDDVAWALIDGTWQYTGIPTPGLVNTAQPATAEEPSPKGSAVKPCAKNQYRHPETKRCRLIAATTSTPKPCAAHQQRNLATGRCRNIVQETGPASCKEGQERNPETNRCRTVKRVPEADYAVLGAQIKQNDSAWYWWVALALAIAAALGYAVWEWRVEIRRVLNRLRQGVRRR